MESLMQKSIYESCKLALPSGLTELMSDISREVLRAQPSDLYQFITDYLAAMLVTRENISIAANICRESSNALCYEDLDEALREIGLDEEDVEKAKEVIFKYFADEKLKETNLMMELIRKTNIDEEILPAVQDAVKKAFKRQLIHHEDILEEYDTDIACAVKHTLGLYEKTKSNKETYHAMAQKIQALYRTYGVRRQCSVEFYNPTKPIKEAKPAASDVNENNGEYYPVNSRTHLRTVSSTTLAGSYMSLPKYKPYSAHDSKLVVESEDYKKFIDYSDPEERSFEEDNQSKESETHVNSHNEQGIRRENLINYFELHVKEQENSELSEDDVQEELDKIADDAITEGSIDEDITDEIYVIQNNNNNEIEDIVDYISDPEE